MPGREKRVPDFVLPLEDGPPPRVYAKAGVDAQSSSSLTLNWIASCFVSQKLWTPASLVIFHFAVKRTGHSLISKYAEDHS